MAKIPLQSGSDEQWVGSIISAYWEPQFYCWIYRIARRANYVGAEAKEEYISKVPLSGLTTSKKFNAWDIQVARGLAAFIGSNSPVTSRKQTGAGELERWADEFRKMREIDKIEESEILRVLEWSQKDIFWNQNILSAGKFRKQFDTLQRQSLNQNRGGSIL